MAHENLGRKSRYKYLDFRLFWYLFLCCPPKGLAKRVTYVKQDSATIGTGYFCPEHGTLDDRGQGVGTALLPRPLVMRDQLPKMNAGRLSAARRQNAADAEREHLSVSFTDFSDFYESEYRSVVGLAYVLCGSRSVAEDLTQDAFTDAHKAWSKIEQYDNPGAWVRRVLVNKSTSRVRRAVFEAKALTRIGSRPAPVGELEERSEEVWAAVRSLPTRQSQAVALYYWEDLSLQQIAEVLDCGAETVKTHLKRGRMALAAKLGEHHGGVGQ